MAKTTKQRIKKFFYFLLFGVLLYVLCGGRKDSLIQKTRKDLKDKLDKREKELESSIKEIEDTEEAVGIVLTEEKKKLDDDIKELNEVKRKRHDLDKGNYEKLSMSDIAESLSR